MNRIYRQIIAFLLIILPLPPASAQVFSGQVTNEKGEPLPFVALYLREISSGFITDDTGHFQTTVKAGSYTCEASSLGYSREIFNVRIPQEGLEKEIVLRERVYELREVNITGNNEDPAYAVMRRAIANAPKYQTYVRSYTAETYLKGSGRLNHIPGIFKLSKEVRTESEKYLERTFLLEEQRTVHYTAPSTWKNEVHAYSSTFPDNMRVSIESTDANLYLPKVFGKISPLSPGAFSLYEFKLDGCFNEGRYLVNKIAITPKLSNPELVSGYIYIVEDLWCISALDYIVTSQGIAARIQVTCKEVRPALFLATSLSMVNDIDMFGVKAEAAYMSAIKYKEIKLESNLVLPERADDKVKRLQAKEIFTTKDAYRMARLMSRATQRGDSARRYRYELPSRLYQAETDSLAGERDSVYWSKVRTVPLRPEEVESYAHRDKLLKEKATGGMDSLKRTPHILLKTILTGHTLHTQDGTKWLRFYNLLSFIPEYNFVDGLWIGAKINAGIKLSDKTTLQATPYGYYTTSRKKWIWGGTLVLDYAPRRMGKFQGEAGQVTADFNGETGESRLPNSLSSLLLGKNYIKLYDRSFISARNEVEIFHSLKLTTGLSWERRITLDNAVNRSLFGKKAQPNVPGNPDYVRIPANLLLQTDVALEYTPQHYYRMVNGKKQYENSRYPTITLAYRRAIPYGGDRKLTASFNRLELSLNQDIKFDFFNSLKWFVNAGTMFDKKDLYFADFKHFAATKLFFTRFALDRTFALINNYEYSTCDRWAQGHLMWTTPKLLLKRIPYLRNQLFDEALHLRTLLVKGRDVYSELGYSVGIPYTGRIGVFAGFEKTKCRSVGVTLSVSINK